jgi:hypothetical protein
VYFGVKKKSIYSPKVLSNGAALSEIFFIISSLYVYNFDRRVGGVDSFSFEDII